jgi:TRAP-type mannitol/chloroaromatic compound transport system substrate-binding protein
LNIVLAILQSYLGDIVSAMPTNTGRESHLAVQNLVQFTLKSLMNKSMELLTTSMENHHKTMREMRDKHKMQESLLDDDKRVIKEVNEWVQMASQRFDFKEKEQVT